MEGTHYKTLGVSSTASQEDIKRAYRKAALMYHPDKNKSPGAEEAFKKVVTAYTVLSDETQRVEYDRSCYKGLKNRFEKVCKHIPPTNRGDEGIQETFDRFFAPPEEQLFFDVSYTWIEEEVELDLDEMDDTLWSIHAHWRAREQDWDTRFLYKSPGYDAYLSSTNSRSKRRDYESNYHNRSSSGRRRYF